MIDSRGTVDATGNVTFTAGQEITLKAGFTASAGSGFLARIMPNVAMQVRDYLGGIEYFETSLEAIYYAGGRILYDANSSERQYVLSDYQGNTRVLFRENNGVAEELQSNSYYPHGSVHEEQSDYLNKYLNEGKELQTELGLEWSDYHLRCKDNWMGRFTGIDVLADSYSNASPYSYGLGNPVSNGDPTGASVEKYTGEEAQSVFSSLKSSYNSAVASGQKVNKNLWSSGGSSGGGVGLQANSYNGSALSGQFSSLFGMLSGGGDEEEQEENDEVGFGESLIPVWGSAKMAYYDYKKGNYVMAGINTFFAITDVFLVKSLITGATRAIGRTMWKSGSHTWGATRSWLGRRGLAARNQEVHHWLFHRNGRIGRNVPNNIKNQPWNLINMPMDTRVHDAIHGGGIWASRQIPYLLWFGTPDYFKGGLSNMLGTGINEFRKN